MSKIWDSFKYSRNYILFFNFQIRYLLKENKNRKIQLEVDFVVNRGNIRYYIQSALTLENDEKREQELNSLKRIDDSFKKIVIVKDDIIPRYDEQGIYYIGIKDFLLTDSVFEN